MEKIKRVIEQRPNYYRGQLLLEGDFLAEQNYHVDARRRHNRHVHGWGVVHGLTVSRHSEHALTIQRGVAIDESGYEIFFEETQPVSLAEFGPYDLLRISLKYEEAPGFEGSAGAPQKTHDFYAVITVARVAEDTTGLTLARVQLDGQGKVGEESIDYSHTRYARLVAPGSITSTELHETLRKGWLRVPFRPVPLVNVPLWEEEMSPVNALQGAEEIPPAFRVGATEVLTPDSEESNNRDRGAAGTMAIPIPPSVTRVTRMRIAGARNEG
jgi:hypothetical protein